MGSPEPQDSDRRWFPTLLLYIAKGLHGAKETKIYKMTKFIKIALIIAVTFIAAILLSLIGELNLSFGGVIKYFVICPAWYWGVRAIWKYESDIK